MHNTMAKPSVNEAAIATRRGRESPVTALLRLTENAGLLRTSDGQSYAEVSVRGRSEAMALKSDAFRHWLIEGYYRACRELPSDWAIRRVLGALEAIARFEAGTPSVFVRVGHDGNSAGSGSACYLDLADPGGRAVKFGPDGWSVVDKPPVRFQRPDGYLELPIPTAGGSIDLLRPYVNLSDRDFRLLIVWMAAALRPAGPYPILAIHGHQGTAKSTLARIVRQLIDPRAKPLRGEPRDTRMLMGAAVDGWLLAYDNISVISRSLSDGLCLLATGGALAGHASSASGGRSVTHAQRPIMLSGTDDFVARGDLADRCVFLDLPPITPRRRRCEVEFWEAFHREYPRILGALLDAVVGGLQELPSVRPAELPRMADFAKFAEAVGRKLGWGAGTALADYNANRSDASLDRLEGSPLAAFLLDLSPDCFVNWSGPASDLHEELIALAREKANSDGWPKTPQRLSVELHRIAPQLAIHGLFVHSSRRHRGRVISISRDHKADDLGV